MDSWIVSHRFDGSTTRSYVPASTEGARSFSARSSGSSSSSASQCQPPADGRSGQELPAAADRRCQRAHRLEAVVRQGQRLELRLQADPVLGGPCPVEVGQVALLRHGEQRRRRVRDGVVVTEAPAPLGQQGDLVGQRHGGRVDLERTRPRDVAVRRLGRQFDAPAAGPARDPCHLQGPAHQVGRLLRPHVDRGGEPDRAVGHDAHAHAEVRVVGRRLGTGVVEAHGLAADSFDPQLGRLTARGGIERGIRQCREVVGGERHQPTGVGWRSGRPAEL